MAPILKASDIIDQPHMVAPLPYLNFLRYFKRRHPRYGLRRLLQEAPAAWDSLTEYQKHFFEKRRILARCSRAVQQRRRLARRAIYDTRRKYGRAYWRRRNHRSLKRRG